jgi:hypothetical protein
MAMTTPTLFMMRPLSFEHFALFCNFPGLRLQAAPPLAVRANRGPG